MAFKATQSKPKAKKKDPDADEEMDMAQMKKMPTAKLTKSGSAGITMKPRRLKKRLRGL